MMETVELDPSVKEENALTPVERMTVVHSQWHASIDVVKILVPSLELVAEMLSVDQRIIVRFVTVLPNSRETQESSVKELSSFKLLPVSPIINVSLDSSVKTVLVSRDADTMSIVLLTRLASTDSVQILVHSLMHADPTLIVFPTHIVQSVHVNQDLLEMRESTANLSETSSSATEIMSVEEDSSVNIIVVSLDVEQILTALLRNLASTVSVRILVDSLESVDEMRSALPSITQQSVLVLPSSEEIPIPFALKPHLSV